MSSSTLAVLPAATTTPAATSPSHRWGVASLSLATLLSALGTSIANVGLPALEQAFSAPFRSVQWVVLAYLLAVTTLIVGVGRLGDLVGRRRLLLIGIAIFTVASGLCGAAPSLGGLIAARAAQGLGAAIMLALAMALISETAPAGKNGAAMGLLGTMSAVGTALGPTLGGVLLSAFGWRAIFLVNLPLGVVAFLLARSHVRRDRSSAGHAAAGFDVLGMVLLAATLAAFALAMTAGRGRTTLALLLAALLGTALFLFVEARVAKPLLPLPVFRDRALRAGLVLSAVVSTVIMATLVVGPFYLSRTLGLGAAAVGLVMSAGPLVAAFTSAPAGRAVDRIGTGRMVLAGLVGIVVGCGALALLPSELGLTGYLVPLVIVTASYALFQAANNTAVMAQVGADRRGLISGLLNLSRNLGLIGGASAMGAVFAFASGSSNLAHAGAEAAATGMRATFGVAATLVLAALGAVALGRRKR